VRLLNEGRRYCEVAEQDSLLGLVDHLGQPGLGRLDAVLFVSSFLLAVHKLYISQFKSSPPQNKQKISINSGISGNPKVQLIIILDA
jgi:hypothetical protein